VPEVANRVLLFCWKDAPCGADGIFAHHSRHSTSARRPASCGSAERVVSNGIACSIHCPRFTMSRSRSC